MLIAKPNPYLNNRRPPPLPAASNSEHIRPQRQTSHLPPGPRLHPAPGSLMTRLHAVLPILSAMSALTWLLSLSSPSADISSAGSASISGSMFTPTTVSALFARARSPTTLSYPSMAVVALQPLWTTHRQGPPELESRAPGSSSSCQLSLPPYMWMMKKTPLISQA